MTQTDGEIYHVLGLKNQYCQNNHTIQRNLQIQCNPYQITSGIFHRTRIKNFTIRMEAQKTPDSQVILKIKNGAKESTFLNSDYPTNLQSRQYGISTKIET